MGYEIPQELEYKEKIMFGLTFPQLAYAFLFAGISLLLFKRIDNFSVKVILMLILLILSCVLAVQVVLLFVPMEL